MQFYTCEECGQIQRCVGERYWVRDYGPIWIKKLAELWNDPEQTLRDIARTLGTNCHTVKSQVLKTDLEFPRRVRKCSSVRCFEHLLTGKAEKLATKVAAWRSQWIAMRKLYPDDNARKLRTRATAAYAALFRYDRQWLKQNQPVNQKWWPKGKSRTDWDARDAVLSAELQAAASKLRSQLKPGRRLTRHALVRSIRIHGWLEHRLNRLPKCQLILAQETDTTESSASPSQS